jgi:hypothetical protein
VAWLKKKSSENFFQIGPGSRVQGSGASDGHLGPAHLIPLALALRGSGSLEQRATITDARWNPLLAWK